MGRGRRKYRGRTNWARRYVNRLGHSIKKHTKHYSYKKNETIEKRDEPYLLNKIKKAIDIFVPSQEYKSEIGYHAELQGWLKANFPNSVVEYQIGRSRPDIVIGDIAIEVKGPTKKNELQTVADKCMRYSKNFKGGFIIVLFDVFVLPSFYKEWSECLKEQFPKVILIRKEIKDKKELIEPAGAKGISHNEYMTKIKKDFPKAYEPWTSREESMLLELFSKGEKINSIASILKRKPGAIKQRLIKLGQNV